MKLEDFKIAEAVYDRWWFWRSGIIIKKFKNTLHIKWLGGKIAIYDREHVEIFLEKL